MWVCFMGWHSVSEDLGRVPPTEEDHEIGGVEWELKCVCG